MNPTRSDDAGNKQSRRQAGRAGQRPGSEQDLPLKLAMRRLFWSMGASTCLDVKLRAYVAGDKRGAGWQEFTDLDVLSVACSLGGQPQITLADCTTSSRRAIERMFWIRGVADFFAADDAYLVRSKPVPVATRALSTRLRVGVLDPDDYTALLRTFPTSLELEGPLGCLFDHDSVRIQLDNTAGLDRKLRGLAEFVRFDYWIYEPYRNLTQVVAHLADAVGTLNTENPHHLSLFFEAAWLYALALIQATHHVRISQMADVPAVVRTYVAGGELAVREKRALAELLNQAGIRVDTRTGVLPPYIDPLTELITRLLVRPAEFNDVLRYAEYLTTAAVIGERATVGSAFGEAHVRPIAAKLLADVCGFLVTASGIRPDFRTAARECLVLDLTGGDPNHTWIDGRQQSDEPVAVVPQLEDIRCDADVPSLPFDDNTLTERPD